jgi:hypothetical protein
MATARAAKPATCAISEPAGVPPRESADTLATGLAPSASGEPGETVGNGLAGAKTTPEAAAAGSVARSAALPATVRLTAVTFVAVSGTVTSAWNCR